MSRELRITRRRVLAAGTALAAGNWSHAESAPVTGAGHYRLAVFACDVTPRLGHPLLGTRFKPALRIADRLEARGFVLQGAGAPIVLVAIDWCELRNDAFARWREVLAEAAGTTPAHVLVHAVHQHDAPYFDLTAQKLLAASPHGGLMCDADFHEHAVQAAAAALRTSLAMSRPITHLGMGQAKVERVASNRRVLLPDGRATFGRYSRTTNSSLREAPEGTIDPWLKTISFWDGDRALAALSTYACHPMSHYGDGDISGDFVSLARRRRQQDDPQVFQIYATGCAGDVTAGKYNDGSPGARGELADRLYRAMAAAWRSTERQPLAQLDCRSQPMLLPHSELASMAEPALRTRLDGDLPLYRRAEAALGLSSLARNPAGHAIDLQMIDFGAARIVLFPAESFVAYQLLAQRLMPDGFVLSLGFGECAPGYIPTDAAFREGYRDEHGYCWVRPGAEAIIDRTVRQLLRTG
ncbi:MAG TPA: hypothetical protein VHV55_03400 [Pirellulales bacterium]|jgi:hypothetical protein|nr:hypothetical protein [Pirellulales bacterium]